MSVPWVGLWSTAVFTPLVRINLKSQKVWTKQGGDERGPKLYNKINEIISDSDGGSEIASNPTSYFFLMFFPHKVVLSILLM